MIFLNCLMSIKTLWYIRYDCVVLNDYDNYDIIDDEMRIFENDEYYYYEDISNKIKPFINICYTDYVFDVLEKFIMYMYKEYHLVFSNYVVLRDLYTHNYRVIFQNYNINYKKWKMIINNYMKFEKSININPDFYDENSCCYSIPSFMKRNKSDNINLGPSFIIDIYLQNKKFYTLTDLMFKSIKISPLNLLISNIDNTLSI